MENQGAYFVNLPEFQVALSDSISQLAESQYDAAPADRRLLCEFYPLSEDRDRSNCYRVPLIDIYIPMFNAENYIEEAINSCLNQSIKDLRICISDDGSSDRSVEIVREIQTKHPNIVLEEHRNSGISITTMKAISLGNGLLIGQLDSDDLLEKNACETLLNELLGDESVGLAYGSCERIDAKGDYLQKEYSWPTFSRKKMLQTSICHHFRMWKRKYYNRTSGFNPFIVNGIDYDFFSKLAEITKAIHIDKTLYRRRWHGENTSIRREADQTRNTYICILNSLNRQGLTSIRPVAPNQNEPRRIKFADVQTKPALIYFPDYSRSNPYQKLLYSGLKDGVVVNSGSIDHAIGKLKYLETEVYFHLHWLNFLFRDCADYKEADLAVINFLNKIEEFKKEGGKLIWTIHNKLEHDKKFIDADLKLRKALCQLADRIHLHDKSSYGELIDANPVPEDKLLCQEHGNYIGYYGDFNPEYRKKSILAGKQRVLFVGQLRNYKGLDRVVIMAKN